MSEAQAGGGHPRPWGGGPGRPRRGTPRQPALQPGDDDGASAPASGQRRHSARRWARSTSLPPSDVERIEQRLRSLSNRLEALEDRLDDALDELAALRRRPPSAPGAPAGDRASRLGPRRGVAAAGSGTSPDRGVAEALRTAIERTLVGRRKAGARGIGRAPHGAGHPSSSTRSRAGRAGSRASSPGAARARAPSSPGARQGAREELGEPAGGAGAATRGPRGRAAGQV